MLLRKEYLRIKKLGAWYLVSWLQIILYFKYAPEFVEFLWPKALKLYEYLDWEPWVHVCVTATLWHAFWLALGNFILWGLYHF